MNKKIIAIGIISMFLLTSFTALSAVGMEAVQMVALGGKKTIYVDDDNPSGHDSLEVTEKLTLGGGGNNIDRWAVIVGTEEYLYSVNDAVELEEVLLNHGWQEEHIKLLTETNATRTNILDAIQWMESKEEEDDIVMFFFSGHGELGKIKTHNSDGPGYITKKRLNIEFSKFESSKMVLIFDTCYSGSMPVDQNLNSGFLIKGFNYPQISDDSNIIETECIVDQNDEEQSSEEFFDGLDTPRCVILAACAWNELAYSHRSYKNSVFSYYLLEGFAGCADEIVEGGNDDSVVSAEEAFAYAAPKTTATVCEMGHQQNPQMYDGCPGEVEITMTDPQERFRGPTDESTNKQQHVNSLSLFTQLLQSIFGSPTSDTQASTTITPVFPVIRKLLLELR